MPLFCSSLGIRPELHGCAFSQGLLLTTGLWADILLYHCCLVYQEGSRLSSPCLGGGGGRVWVRDVQFALIYHHGPLSAAKQAAGRSAELFSLIQLSTMTQHCRQHSRVTPHCSGVNIIFLPFHLYGTSAIAALHNSCAAQHLGWYPPPPTCASTRKDRKVTVRPGPGA